MSEGEETASVTRSKCAGGGVLGGERDLSLFKG